MPKLPPKNDPAREKKPPRTDRTKPPPLDPAKQVPPVRPKKGT